MSKPLQEDQNKPVRLAKAMADAGLCSRREAERWIEAGRVTLNGQPQTTPAVTVTPDDEVLVDGKPIQNKPEQPRLFLYNKPSGIICSAVDPEGRPTVFDKLPKSFKKAYIQILQFLAGTAGQRFPQLVMQGTIY